MAVCHWRRGRIKTRGNFGPKHRGLHHGFVDAHRDLNLAIQRRKQKMRGHVRERGKGNWYAVLDVRDPATGKRRRKWHSLQAKGKREAQIECADLISRLAHGTYLEPDKTTLAEFLDRWLEHTKANVAPRTHERHAEIAKKNIAPLLGNAILAKLKPAQLSEAYRNTLSEGRRDGKGGLSPRTVLHMHRVLKQALKQG